MSERLNISPNLIIRMIPNVFHHNLLCACQAGHFCAIHILATQVFNKMQRFQRQGFRHLRLTSILSDIVRLLPAAGGGEQAEGG